MTVNWTVVAILLAVHVYHIHGTFPFTEQTCSVGDSMCCDLSSEVDQPRGVILHQEAFSCSGCICSWEINAARNGTFYACVWEQLGAQTYKLKSFNTLQVQTAGFHEFELAIPQQIPVEPGDVIGVMYDEGDQAVLRADYDPMDSTAFFSLDGFHSLQGGAGVDVDIGFMKNLSSDMPSPGKIAIQALVRGYSDCLRLWPTDIPRKGRAEIKINDTWGTVCDRWFNLTGWPLTFCQSLGYPEATVVKYVSDLDLSQGDPEIDTANDSVPVHLQSPHLCKPSLNKTIFECPVQSSGQCDHDLDLYLECNSRVRCYNQTTVETDGCVQHTCIPQLWVKGCWGSICDNRGLFFLARDPSSWVPVFCASLDLGQLANLGFHGPEVVFEHPIIAINPTCEPGASSLDQCPPVVSDITCEQGDGSGVPWITCQIC